MLKLVLVCLAGQTLAAPTFNLEGTVDKETPDQKFIRSDENKDNQLTFDEFLHMDVVYEHAKKEDFDSIDVNKDHLLTRAEWTDHHNPGSARSAASFNRVFEEFDSDLDMSLSAEEFSRVLEEHFLVRPKTDVAHVIRAFDADGNGSLDLVEYIRLDANFPKDDVEALEGKRRVVRQAGQEVRRAVHPHVAWRAAQQPLWLRPPTRW